MKNNLAVAFVFASSLSLLGSCHSAEPASPLADLPEEYIAAAAADGLAPGPLRDALDWLAAHQSEDGSWDADSFRAECAKVSETTCANPGLVQHDVAATGLALLALLGADNEADYEFSYYPEELEAGVRWLRHQQDADTGLIGTKSGHEFLYNHAIATFALCEAYREIRSPLLKLSCQKAVNYIARARNPYGAWRYDEPPMGDNDTSVTGWMILALKSAERARLIVDQGAYEGALSWLDEVSDSSTGRVGYNAHGSYSSRISGINDHFAPENGEAMTAIGLAMRLTLGQTDTEAHPILEKHGDLILRSLPEWQTESYANDMYYWYHATFAMHNLGGVYWAKWDAALKAAMASSQQTSGHAKGSWDPIGPWGFAGGRVYSTALMAMCLEVEPEGEEETALKGLGYL